MASTRSGVTGRPLKDTAPVRPAHQRPVLGVSHAYAKHRDHIVLKKQCALFLHAVLALSGRLRSAGSLSKLSSISPQSMCRRRADWFGQADRVCLGGGWTDEVAARFWGTFTGFQCQTRNLGVLRYSLLCFTAINRQGNGFEPQVLLLSEVRVVHYVCRCVSVCFRCFWPATGAVDSGDYRVRGSQVEAPVAQVTALRR